ncbi:type III restriction-modification system endonuclease [Deinococcus budaensis]|uniref:Type III restriction enzyme n=1 Tax=Deinococcus budaensis TaxID=1665626 RepID=A0A7W8GHN5_9DEIO|nr:DEAD/DEAH box helicase family protein [Deinococcus budaensis]MBB5235514.1 type III restriction enzyme [Deinococcus budaensis]
MKIQFESNLDYQAQAVEAVAGLFAGQDINRTEFTVSAGVRGNQPDLGLIESDLGIGNRLGLLPDEIHKNLNGIQLGNGLAPSASPLVGDYTIEMETGTGKTYVYLRTAFELHRRYGFTKFVIVVPSIAIKEGVMKSLEMTGTHFKTLYPEAKGYSFYAYDSAKLNQVRDFATSSSVRFMVATIQSLYSVQEAGEDIEGGKAGGKGKAERVIHRPHEQTGGERPIDLVRATNPVLIVDEPQSVYGDAGKGKKGGGGQGRKALSLLNPLATLRYSATPLDRTQLVFRLDAVDAYERKLVKGIEVASMQVSSGHNRPYVRVVDIKAGKARTGPTATLEIDVLRGDKVTRREVKVQDGDSLQELSGGRDLYHDMLVGEIRSGRGDTMLELKVPGDVLWLKPGEEYGGLNPTDLARAMISRTIREHLDKELLLRPRGIKVLSLFFIDRVSNYRTYSDNGEPGNGPYADLFEDEYKRAARDPRYATLFGGVDLETEAREVHNGYFSEDKKGRFKDTSGSTADDADAYNLIMRKKESLLDLRTPLKFIFSHSALREGWDNPNVFQICVLREIGTERERRQTIGRGLRLAVNQKGERVRDEGVNILTVIASESYEDFAENLQKEIEEDLQIKFGVVEEHQFATIPLVDGQGNVTPLGIEKSRELQGFLRSQGYLSSAGKVEDKLRVDLKADTVHLPEAFETVRPDILAVLKKLAGKLDIRNADETVTVQPNRAVLDDPEFRALWDRISARTTYEVEVDTEVLISECVKAVNAMPIVPRSQVQTTIVDIEVDRSGVQAKVKETHAPTTLREDDLVLPDLLGALQDRTELTRRTLSAILRDSDRLGDFKKNPQAFIELVSAAINTRKIKLLVDGIQYHKTGEAYAQTLLDGPIPTLKDILKVKKGAYDHVIYESDVEKSFAADLERNSAVKVYAKLPGWFRVPTPLGDYNPDWAILLQVEDKEKLCFVAETKSTLWTGALREKEALKIDCGRRHFAVLAADTVGGALQYEVVRSLEDVFSQSEGAS